MLIGDSSFPFMSEGNISSLSLNLLIIFLPLSRVKSLSKGGNPKKEPSASLNIRESTTAPLSLVLPNLSAPESSNNDVTIETHRFGWSKQNQRVTPLIGDAVPTGREDARLVSSYSNHSSKSRGSSTPEYDFSDGAYEQESQSGRKAEPYSALDFENKTQRVAAQTKQRDPTDVDNNFLNPDDDLNDLLKVDSYVHESISPFNFK